jgi:hypothetical protein
VTLLAATGFGLSVPVLILGGRLSDHIPFSDHRGLVDFLTFRLPPCMSMWTAALLSARLIHPRPPRRRLMRQPGMVASIAALVAHSFFWLAILAMLPARSGWFREGLGVSLNEFVLDVCSNTLVLMPYHPGLAVAAAWTIQAASGRWRPERSWVDRAGRLMGAMWILGALAWPPAFWFFYPRSFGAGP